MERIVHLIFTLESGGSENMLVDVANEQASLAEVTIILINKKYNIDIVGRIKQEVHFYSLERKEHDRRSLWFLFRLWFLLLKIRPTVIHCHNHNIIRLLPIWRNRAVLTIHCPEVATTHLKKYSKVYSVSAAVSDDVRTRAGIRSPVVLNGINFSDIFQRTDYLFERNMPVRIVQVSRMIHQRKGQHVLLKALHKLTSEEGYRNIHLDFIGTGPSLPYLLDLADTLKLNEQVSFLGERSRQWIYERLSTYHILIQPSLTEPFGLTVLEGIAAGLPVIASDHEGPAEVLRGMPGGYLFRTGDEDDLAYTIRKVMATMQEGKIQQRCEASHEIAARNYSVHRTAFEYLHHYSRLNKATS
jgi:glycosyltransferase involved in cell wall biosynthesis